MSFNRGLVTTSLIGVASLFMASKSAHAYDEVYVQTLTNQFSVSVTAYARATDELNASIQSGLPNSAAAARQMYHLTRALSALNEINQIAISNPRYCQEATDFQKFALENGVISAPTSSYSIVRMNCARYGR